MKLNKSQSAILALIAANIIWGAAPPIFKWALQDIGPFTLAFLRFAVPALIILPFFFKKLQVHEEDRIKVVLIGFFGITVNILFFFQGLLQAPSINASLIASSAPIFIVLFSLFFLKEKPKQKLITGSAIGLLGVFVVLAAPLLKHGNLAPLGNLYYVVAMIGAVAAIILGRQVMRRNSAISITFWSFAFGAVGFIPFFMYEVGQIGFLPNLSLQGFVGLIFGIFFSSLAAYFLHMYGLKYLTASDVSVFAYIDPMVTILVAAPLLGEFPDLAFVIGSVLVIYGILRSEGRFHWHPFHLFLKK